MPEAYSVRKLSPVRRVIAARVTDAYQRVPHFRVMAEIELDGLMQLRSDLSKARPGSRLTLNDLLVKACALALMDVPAVNVQWVDDEVRQYSSADIAVVVALEDGLSTPIVRGAEKKSIWDISQEIRELTLRASRNALRMDEVFGGSFTVSNLGMYGVDEFDAIINVPQCAVLSVGAAKPQVIAASRFETRIATIIRATLSVDHRVLDGAGAASFLKALRTHIEQPTDLKLAMEM
jgi:pyruvate dehydrogenase E2 component (dihydrolipoyllysine-residue acetyltransferase)